MLYVAMLSHLTTQLQQNMKAQPGMPLLLLMRYLVRLVGWWGGQRAPLTGHFNTITTIIIDCAQQSMPNYSIDVLRSIFNRSIATQVCSSPKEAAIQQHRQSATCHRMTCLESQQICLD